MKSRFIFLCLILTPLTTVGSDYRFEVELLQDSDLVCGIRLGNNEVEVVNVQPLLNSKHEAVNHVHLHFPDQGIESPIPVLIEKAHLDGQANRNAVLRDAVRESAFRGCDLLIVLDFAVYDKVMFRPSQMDLKLPVSYVLVLFGSQVKNSAQPLIE